MMIYFTKNMIYFKRIHSRIHNKFKKRKNNKNNGVIIMKTKDKNFKNRREIMMAKKRNFIKNLKEITIIIISLLEKKMIISNSNKNEILNKIITTEEMITITLISIINHLIKIMDIIITMGIRILGIKINNSIIMSIKVIMNKKRIIGLGKSLKNGMMNLRMKMVKIISFKKDITIIIIATIILKQIIIVNKVLFLIF